jgi:hypothetical protein
MTIQPPNSSALTPVVTAPSSKGWERAADTYTLKTTQDRFIENITKDVNSGSLRPEANALLDAVLSPGKRGLPKVQVKTFAVDGIQAKDIMVIQREPPVPDGPNIVLYIPEKEGSSFQAFNTLKDMNAWLKALAADPKRLETFSQHFTEDGSPARQARLIDTMTRFKDDDINAIVGPYANEGSDIFKRLDNAPSAPPGSVNGLTNIKQERFSPEGRVLYSGQRADGEKVLFMYDAYGNLLGEDQKKNFYFVKNGLNSHKPLVPMTIDEFKTKVQNEAANNVGANDIRGLYDELLAHLQHPFYGMGDALQVFGVNKNTADTVERYFDNPFSALLVDLNKNNQIGKVFGLDKASMDADLKSAGDFAQGFVPSYGQARMLGGLLTKALKNEPLSDQETRDLADSLALKPDSLARRNLSAKPSPVPARFNKPIELPEPPSVAKVAPPGRVDGLLDGLFDSWFGRHSTPPNIHLNDHFRIRVEEMQSGAQAQAYERGYTSGKPEDIPGYSSGMKANEIKTLALKPERTPEEVGALVKGLEKIKSTKSLNDYLHFKTETQAAGGTARGMPQDFYLSNVDVLSTGECAALSNTMALAIEQGKEDVFIDNLFKAAAPSKDPAVAKFRKDLDSLHTNLAYNYHSGAKVSRLTHREIMSELANAPHSKTLRISDEGHGVIAGVTVDNNNKSFFFYDPNFGMAKFPTQASMEQGLDSLLRSGKVGRTRKPFGNDPALPKYDVSEFKDTDFYLHSGRVNPIGLFNKPL